MHGKAVVTRLVLRLVTEARPMTKGLTRVSQTHESDVFEALLGVCAQQGRDRESGLSVATRESSERGFCLWQRDDGERDSCGFGSPMRLIMRTSVHDAPTTSTDLSVLSRI